MEQVDKPRASTVDYIVDQLRAGIRSGRYKGGARLVEAELTDSFGVSRGPVREAMRRLAAEGLIDIHMHKGARVRLLSRHEVLALFDVREMLEGLSARLAAANSDAAKDRAKLKKLATAMAQAAKHGDIGIYIALNTDFHNLLVAMSNNPHLPQLLAQLHTQAMRFQFRQLADRSNTQASDREHQRIIQAILDNDPEYAERSMRVHIRRSRDMTMMLPDDMFSLV